MGRLSKAKWCLIGCLMVMLILVASSIFVPDRLTNAVKWLANNDFAGKLRGQSEREAATEGTLVEMVVDSIRISKTSYQPVVILKEKEGKVYLPIWIGPLEANAISVIVEGVETPRPLTPDLLCSIIGRMEASVDCVVINNLQNNIFYANITVNANWRQIEIDARPSDAIAIALRVRAPIYVERSVLDKAGTQPEEAEEYAAIHIEKDKLESGLQF